MMSDIFSTFDPHSYMYFIPFTLILVMLSPSIISVMNTNLFSSTPRLYAMFSNTYSIMINQLSRTNSYSLKGLSSIISAIFILIILTNLIGMAPYMFSASSHLIITLSMGFPVWLSTVISSFLFLPKHSTAHFLPDGAPDWLNPFLVLIESTSVMVRPMTLSFRLAANMTAGHIVLSLINLYGTGALLTLSGSLIILLPLSSFYILFEFAICLIQAYIFCLLLSLYSDDHASL